ncbi:hypothetical protein C8Q80DRAFT_442831 [Daedaleopsis nitida]|nr:hypothetical protein C8Q80DRAFT_442831 [Daedaleopsis nitida]
MMSKRSHGGSVDCTTRFRKPGGRGLLGSPCGNGALEPCSLMLPQPLLSRRIDRLTNIAQAILLFCQFLFVLPPVSAVMNATFPTNLEQCETVPISWSGGVPPHTLQIGTSFPNSTVLIVTQTYCDIVDYHYAWTVNVSVGTVIGFKVSDSEGQTVSSLTNPNVTAGSTDCVDVYLSGNSSGSMSHSSGLSSSVTAHATSPAVTSKIALPQHRPLDPRIIGALAGVGGVAVLCMVATALLLRRKFRGRRRSVPAFKVDLAESPRITTPVQHCRESDPPSGPRYTSSSSTSGKRIGSRRPHVRADSNSYVVPFPRGPASPIPEEPPAASVRESALERLHRLHTTPFASELFYVPVRAPSPPARLRTASTVGPAPSKRRRLERTLSVPLARQSGASEEILLRDVERGTTDLGHDVIVEEPRRRLSSAPRQELDGGVRIAGGPPGEIPEEDAASVDSIVPPPYHLY